MVYVTNVYQLNGRFTRIHVNLPYKSANTTISLRMKPCGSKNVEDVNN